MKVSKQEALGFDDVLLIPRYSEIPSRANINLRTEVVRGVFIKIPILSASMDTITEVDMAEAMDILGGVGIVHRYLDFHEQVAHLSSFRLRRPDGIIGVAIGVVGDFLERAEGFSTHKLADFLVIDVAHGDHKLVLKALKVLKNSDKVTLPIMVGNVATADAAKRLESHGADAIKVGIGPGSVCTTRIEAGAGYPQFSAVLECAEAVDIPVCADGGIRNSGDIVKALGAGASTVMCGRVLAGTLETPGESFTKDGKKYKIIRGMASEEAKADNGMPNRNIEGVADLVPANGPVSRIVGKLVDGIKSGLSYAGCNTIPAFLKKSTFVKVTSNANHLRKIK